MSIQSLKLQPKLSTVKKQVGNVNINSETETLTENYQLLSWPSLMQFSHWKNEVNIYQISRVHAILILKYVKEQHAQNVIMTCINTFQLSLVRITIPSKTISPSSSSKNSEFQQHVLHVSCQAYGLHLTLRTLQSKRQQEKLSCTRNKARVCYRGFEKSDQGTSEFLSFSGSELKEHCATLQQTHHQIIT